MRLLMWIWKGIAGVFLLGVVAIVVGLLWNSQGAPCLWNCGPNESSVCSDIRSRGVGDSKFRGEVVSCRKVNGYEVSGFGPQRYVMQIEIVAHYPQGFHPECSQGGVGASYNCWFAGMTPGNKFMPPGAKDARTIEAVFLKTERGWQSPDGKLY